MILWLLMITFIIIIIIMILIWYQQLLTPRSEGELLQKPNRLSTTLATSWLQLVEVKKIVSSSFSVFPCIIGCWSLLLLCSLSKNCALCIYRLWSDWWKWNFTFVILTFLCLPGFKDVIKTTVLMKDINKFSEVKEFWSDWELILILGERNLWEVLHRSPASESRFSGSEKI